LSTAPYCALKTEIGMGVVLRGMADPT